MTSDRRESRSDEAWEQLERENEQLRDAVTIWQKLADERKERIDAQAERLSALSETEFNASQVSPSKLGESTTADREPAGYADKEDGQSVLLRKYKAMSDLLTRSVNGECLKCGMGPMRESCAYPEDCEHPGRELSSKLNQAMLALSATRQPSTGPLTLDTDGQVFFYEQDHYYLSNFSAFQVELGDYLFDTAEQAYHFQRFTTGTHRHGIKFASSAHEAFRYAQAHKADQRPDWDAVKVKVMRDILRAKAGQHEYVRRKLLQTGDRVLIENSWRDAFWGWGPKRDGKNMLGVLWMEVRAELRRDSEGTKASG